MPWEPRLSLVVLQRMVLSLSISFPDLRDIRAVGFASGLWVVISVWNGQI